MNLRRMRFLINRLPMARFRVEKAMSQATKCTASLTGMPRGGGGESQVERGAALLEAARRDYDAITGELKAMRAELAPLIELLGNPDERTAAHLRYIDGYSPADIANGMCYCERHVFRLIKRAEEKLEDVSACQSDL